MFGIPPKHSLEDDETSFSDKDLRKRAKYLKRCKESLWKRWRNEYVRSLREQHNMSNGTRTNQVSVGDVVTILSEDKEKNRAKWKLGIVHEIFPGRDGVVRSVRLRAGKTFLNRPVQKLFPLEMKATQPQRSEAQESESAEDNEN